MGCGGSWVRIPTLTESVRIGILTHDQGVPWKPQLVNQTRKGIHAPAGLLGQAGGFFARHRLLLRGLSIRPAKQFAQWRPCHRRRWRDRRDARENPEGGVRLLAHSGLDVLPEDAKRAD